MDLFYLYSLPKWNSNYAHYRDGQNRINWRPYWIYCIYIVYQNEIEIMLIIEMAKIELIGGHNGFMLIIEIAKNESTGGHIEIMLIIEMAKIKLTGGHIGFMLIIEMAKIELTGGHIGFILFI